jgi:putative colanic acid biosysnthesis UDP-glucose lipid carrier transferase
MTIDSIAYHPTKRQAHGRSLSKKMFSDIAILIDVVFALASGYFIKVYYVDTGSGGGSVEGHLSYLSIIALVMTALFAVLLRGRQYHYNANWSFVKESMRLVMAIMFSFGFALFALFIMKESDLFSRVWMLSWCATVFLFLLAGRIFWLFQFRKLSDAGYFRRRVLLIGGGQTLHRIRKNLLLDRTASEIACISDLGLEGEHNSPLTFNHALSAALAHAVLKGQSGAIDEVIIALPSSEGVLLEQVVRRLRLLPVELNVALDFVGYGGKFIELNQIGSANILRVQKKPISDWSVILKALEDYILAILSLIIFLPAMAVIALLIKLDSKGPVLFRQRRHGFNHRIFSVYKFRTMTVTEDGAEITQARKDDKRVTRMGWFLRRTSLDELPQLFNVLAGDMSLVGPRPHAVVHNDHYSQMLENYACRHRVKPGLTGWAQINGLRGEASRPDEMEHRVRYDLEYIDNWSIWFDLKILLLTPIFGFVSRKAY